MMAIGLNMVVGYAGLLDLGYVAFYAVGAYVAGWFATQQFSQQTFHFHVLPVDGPTVPGIHIIVWLLLVRRPCLPRCSASSSACRRCACAATTWRS